MKSKQVKGLLVMGLLALCCAVFTPGKVSAALVNPNYQIFVTDLAGTPIANPVSITVNFYDAATGGSAYWSETQTVTPDSGLCIVSLGAATPFNLDFSRPYYVGVSLPGAGELPTRLSVSGPGSYSRSGDKTNAHELNVKFEWLNLE
jgi:hypothetical protein